MRSSARSFDATRWQVALPSCLVRSPGLQPDKMAGRAAILSCEVALPSCRIRRIAGVLSCIRTIFSSISSSCPSILACPNACPNACAHIHEWHQCISCHTPHESDASLSTLRLHAGIRAKLRQHTRRRCTPKSSSVCWS